MLIPSSSITETNIGTVKASSEKWADMIAVSGRVIAGLIVERKLGLCDLPLFRLPLSCPGPSLSSPHPPSSVFNIHIVYRSCPFLDVNGLHEPVLFICGR